MGEAVFEDDVAAFDISESAEPLSERIEDRRRFVLGSRQNSDARDLGRLLRAPASGHATAAPEAQMLPRTDRADLCGSARPCSASSSRVPEAAPKHAKFNQARPLEHAVARAAAELSSDENQKLNQLPLRPAAARRPPPKSTSPAK
jgi:hypothetical protein